MSIDRKKFMMLALSMSMGATACGPKSPPPAVTPGNTTEAAPAEEAMAPTGECVNWDAASECIEWASADEGMMPAEECTNWDASGECVEWGGAAPANECVDWDATGECVQWQ